MVQTQTQANHAVVASSLHDKCVSLENTDIFFLRYNAVVMSNEITDNSYQSTREIPQLFQNLLFIIDSFKLGFQRLPVAFGCPVSRVSLTLKMIIVTLSFIFLHASDLLKSSQLSCGKFHILNVF